MDTNVISRLEKAVRDGNGDQIVKVKQTVETTIGMHSAVDQIALQGKYLGLRMTHTKAGGWFAKNHLLEFEGQARKVLAFMKWMQQIA